MTPHPTFSRRRAFTLIELLVVISIIALLLAILMPVLSRARDAATTVTCASGLRQIGLAFAMYRDDNNDYLPWTYSPGGYVWATGHLARYVSLRPPESSAAANEYGSQGIFECPADPTDFENIFANTGGRSTFQPSYGMNHRLAGRRASERPDSDRYLLAADSGHTWEDGGSSYLLKNLDVKFHVYPRHGRGSVGNVLWLGGHVSSHSDLEDLNGGGARIWSYYPYHDDPAFN